MADQLSWSAAGEWSAGFVPEGPLRTAVLLVYGLCVAVAPFIYKYHLGVLAQGAQPEGSLERQDYDRLRAGLAGGNLAARLYAKWLTAFLDGVERFFGDVGMADRTLFPRAFGLKKPAPLWTAPALDRCLLLALIYPIATIFVIWAISGHVGPAEAVLALQPELPGWRRGFAATVLGFAGFVAWSFMRTNGWKYLLMWIAACALAGCAIAIVAAATGARPATDAGTVGFFAAVAFGVVISAKSGEALAGPPHGAAAAAAVAVLSFGGPIGGTHALTFGVVVASFLASGPALAIGVAVIATAVEMASAIAFRLRWHGLFLALFLPAMIVVCLVAADLLSPLETWGRAGPLLLFLGLLTLLNAPFDWASLGLTRALLRRGLELGGWWPYLLALVDAALAGVIIALLAPTMVIGVQAFDELAVHGGGDPVLPLDALFGGIAKNPAAPEYWWAYALLLSSMIPSLINLMISGMAFTRGIPWLARLILNWIPEGKAVPEYKRQPAAIGLTVQMFAGAGLGIAAQAFLAWGLIFHVMPWIGLDLLDMARTVAAFDLPMRIGQLFAGTL